MPVAKKGQRFGGRQKGTPNKITQDARQKIAAVAETLDFKKWAQENEGDFWKYLFSKTIPKELNITMQAWVRTLSDEELDQQIKRLNSEIDTQK